VISHQNNFNQSSKIKNEKELIILRQNDLIPPGQYSKTRIGCGPSIEIPYT
jgi:hypothetical protein